MKDKLIAIINQEINDLGENINDFVEVVLKYGNEDKIIPDDKIETYDLLINKLKKSKSLRKYLLNNKIEKLNFELNIMKIEKEIIEQAIFILTVYPTKQDFLQVVHTKYIDQDYIITNIKNANFEKKYIVQPILSRIYI